jgi:hypothetical protein
MAAYPGLSAAREANPALARHNLKRIETDLSV